MDREGRGVSEVFSLKRDGKGQSGVSRALGRMIRDRFSYVYR